MVPGAGFAGSLAAILLPTSVEASGIAAVLALGSLALLAGHAWGLPVVVAADVVLLGKVWPLVVYQEWPPGLAVQVAACAALAGALPGLVALPRTLPGAVDLLAGRRPAPALRALAVGVSFVLAVGWLALPAV